MYARANRRAVERCCARIELEHIDCDLERADSWLYPTTERTPCCARQRRSGRSGWDASFEPDTPLPLRVCGVAAARAGAVSSAEVPAGAGRPADDLRAHAGRARRGRHAVHPCAERSRPGAWYLRVALPVRERAGALLCADASGALLRHRAGERRPAGRHVLRAGAECMVAAQLPWDGHPQRRRAPHRPERRRALCRPARGGAGAVPRQPRGGALVGAGLHDGLRRAYIGRFSARDPQWYVATGFRKWGMSNAMAAAELLSAPDLQRQPSGCRGL